MKHRNNSILITCVFWEFLEESRYVQMHYTSVIIMSVLIFIILIVVLLDNGQTEDVTDLRTSPAPL